MNRVYTQVARSLRVGIAPSVRPWRAGAWEVPLTGESDRVAGRRTESDRRGVTDVREFMQAFKEADRR